MSPRLGFPTVTGMEARASSSDKNSWIVVGVGSPLVSLQQGHHHTDEPSGRNVRSLNRKQ